MTSLRNIFRPLLFAAVTASLAGCADDLHMPSGSDMAEGIILRIPNPLGTTAGVTRAPENEELLDRLDKEGKISSLYLFAFDKTTGKKETPIDLTEVSTHSGELNSHDAYVTYQLDQLLPEGDYHLYVVANLDKHVSGWQNPTGASGKTDEQALLDMLVNFKDGSGNYLLDTSDLESYGIPMACLSSDMKFNNESVDNGSIKIEKNQQAEIHADLGFLCAKVRYTILFDATPHATDPGFSAGSFGDKRLMLNSAYIDNINLSGTHIGYGDADADTFFDLPSAPLGGVIYPDPDKYPEVTADKDERFKPLDSTTPSGDTRAWQGVVYVPENLSADTRTTLVLKGTLDGITGQELTYELPLVPGETDQTALEPITRAKAYDIVAKVTGLQTLKIQKLEVMRWTEHALTYALSENVYLDLEQTSIKKISSDEGVTMAFSTNADLDWDSPKYLADNGKSYNLFEFEIGEDDGLLHISVNPGLPSDYYPIIKANIEDYKHFHLIAGNIRKRIDIEELDLHRFLSVTPPNITIGVHEIIASQQYEGSFDIQVRTNIPTFTLASTTWEESELCYLADENGNKIPVNKVFNMADYPDGEVNLKVVFKDLNGGDSYWNKTRTGTDAMRLNFRVSNTYIDGDGNQQTYTGNEYITTQTVRVNTTSSTDNYIIHFKPKGTWSAPHIYIYQVLTLPANLSSRASMPVGYKDNTDNAAALEYCFTGKIAFKGWDSQYNKNALAGAGSASMAEGFVLLGNGGKGSWNPNNDDGSHYNLDYDFMESYRSTCDCTDCQGSNYNQLWPGIIMEEESEGWWKIELTGVADPGKTLIMWKDGHKVEDTDNRYPARYKNGVPLFDYPSREGWYVMEDETFYPEKPGTFSWEDTDGTIYFDNTDNWTTPYVYYWSSTNQKMTSWPGVAMTYDSAAGKWKAKISTSAEYLIFSNNGANQTDDLDIDDTTDTYNMAGSVGGSGNSGTGGGVNSPDGKVPDKMRRIYFKISWADWNDVRCHAWGTSGNTNQMKMTSSKYSDWYYADVPDSYTNVIFTKTYYSGTWDNRTGEFNIDSSKNPMYFNYDGEITGPE